VLHRSVGCDHGAQRHTNDHFPTQEYAMALTAPAPNKRRRMTAHPQRRIRAVIVAALASTGLLLATAGSALATFPGRNGLIAFHSQTAHGTQIFTVRSNGHELRQITHVDGDAIAVDWSPDGQRIAFEIDTPDTAQVALMNADGSDLVTLPGVGLFNGDPSFTPDGRRLVYGFFDGEHGGIASMTLDGGDQRVIRVDDFIEDPNVSPDGGTISVTCQQDPDVLQALCTMPVAGSALPALPNLTPFTAEVGAKSDWAPDGRQLLFTDHADLPNPGDSANVAVVASDGTGEHLLTHFSGGQDNAFAGSYSPDGRWTVFRLEDHGQFALMRMRPDGSHMRAILPLSGFAARFIDWGPRPDRDNHRDQRDGD
jgi:dipeptidyl aminopeptidase/acylaminoacyl peptidase